MADFYAVTDFDDLRFATVDEAVKNYLDEVEPADRWRTLHVKAYRRMQPDLDNFAANDLITGVVEKWDEELGDPDSDATCLILDADMRALIPLALALLQQIAARYRPWACEESPEEHVEVELELWLREHDYAPKTVRAT
jgi:hypothetical protein